MYFTRFVRLASLLILICWSLPAGGQQGSSNKPAPARSVSYGFVSPNTREDLKLEDAVQGLSSKEETRLINRANSLRCIARSRIQTFKAIGSWSDGAEHSVLLRTQSDSSTMRYLLAQLGKDNNQKAVLHFQLSGNGSATMYILRPQRHRGLRALTDILDRAGIGFRTLIPQKRSARVYVVDLKRELHSKIIVPARRLRVSVTSRRGSAEFIGDHSSRESSVR